mmetsp:Transcript_19151/g.41479  ORF Transcript_19151/g.41479 Transcript_19151/m.41479 type:complete len:1093 (+) Transcript_19151:196-3474(+)
MIFLKNTATIILSASLGHCTVLANSRSIPRERGGIVGIGGTLNYDSTDSTAGANDRSRLELLGSWADCYSTADRVLERRADFANSAGVISERNGEHQDTTRVIHGSSDDELGHRGQDSFSVHRGSKLRGSSQFPDNTIQYSPHTSVHPIPYAMTERGAAFTNSVGVKGIDGRMGEADHGRNELLSQLSEDEAGGGDLETAFANSEGVIGRDDGGIRTVNHSGGNYLRRQVGKEYVAGSSANERSLFKEGNVAIVGDIETKGGRVVADTEQQRLAEIVHGGDSDVRGHLSNDSSSIHVGSKIEESMDISSGLLDADQSILQQPVGGNNAGGGGTLHGSKAWSDQPEATSLTANPTDSPTCWCSLSFTAIIYWSCSLHTRETTVQSLRHSHPTMPSFYAMIVPFVLLLLTDGASAFLAKAPVTSLPSSASSIRLQTATNNDVIIKDASRFSASASADAKHAVVGSTQIHREPRNMNGFPTLQNAFLADRHPIESQEELGRGTFVASDWRQAWHTYGQCDRSITQAEYEKGGFTVDPFTGEADYEIDDIDGELPNDLVGVLYRNGPGKFGVNGERVAHILDADGLVLRFEFMPHQEDSSSRIRFTSRFVETDGFCEERESQAFTKRGTFGTAPRGLNFIFGEPKREGLNKDPEDKPPLLARMAANAFQVDIKNTANTQVIAFGGKVLALWEAGLPYRLDPVTLKTIGEDSLGDTNVLKGKLPVNTVPGLPSEFQPSILGGKAYTAHPKLCPRTGRLVAWTWAQNAVEDSMEVTFTEYDPDGFRQVASETHVLDGCALAPHDMILTENYILLKINSLKLDKVSFLSGDLGPAECLGMDGREPVRVFAFPRPTLSPEKKKKFSPFIVNDVPACFSLHFSHGYEDEKTGNIVSYFSGWPQSDSKTFLGAWGGFSPDYLQIPVTFYWRMEIDPTIEKCVDLRVSPGAENMCIEHPVVHPNFATKDATFAYSQCCNAVGDASAPMGYAKLRLDGGAVVQPNLKVGEKNEEVDVYWIGSRRFTGEPLVVPKLNGNLEREEDAYLLGLVYDAVEDKSAIMVFDLARELKEGPVCTIWLKTALPHGLHGCFSPDSSVKTSYFC